MAQTYDDYPRRAEEFVSFSPPDTIRRNLQCCLSNTPKRLVVIEKAWRICICS